MDTADGAGAAPSPDGVPALPERLAARFVLGEVVARGPGRLVVRARDVLLDRAAAVTFHTPGARTPGEDGPAGARTRSTVEALARLDHPHLVPVYDVGTGPDGTVAVVTSWSGGGDLADRIDTGALGTVDTLAAVAAVADALDHVHRSGLVHGAVSPQAVRLDDDGRALLAGAGTASLHGRPDADPADDVRDLAGVLRAGLGSTPVPAEAAGLVDAAEGDPAGRPTAAELVVGLRLAAVSVGRAEAPAAVPAAVGGAPRRLLPASRGALAVAGAALSVLLAGTVVVASGWPVAPAAESDGAAPPAPALALPTGPPSIAPDAAGPPADPTPRGADAVGSRDPAPAGSPRSTDRGPEGRAPAAGPMPVAPPPAAGPSAPPASGTTTPTRRSTTTPASPTPTSPTPTSPGPTTPAPTPATTPAAPADTDPEPAGADVAAVRAVTAPLVRTVGDPVSGLLPGR